MNDFEPNETPLGEHLDGGMEPYEPQEQWWEDDLAQWWEDDLAEYNQNEALDYDRE